MPGNLSLSCPFCDYGGRSDALRRHIAARHPKDEMMTHPPPGTAVLPGTDIIVRVLPGKEGQADRLPSGVCMSCSRYIKNTGPASENSRSTKAFITHICKPPQVRNYDKSAKPEQKMPETTDAKPKGIDWEELWDGLREHLRTYTPATTAYRARAKAIRSRLPEMMESALEFNTEDDVIDYKSALFDFIADMTYMHPLAEAPTAPASEPAAPPKPAEPGWVLEMRAMGIAEETIADMIAKRNGPPAPAPAPAAPAPPPPPPGPKPPAPVRGTIGFTIF